MESSNDSMALAIEEILERLADTGDPTHKEVRDCCFSQTAMRCGDFVVDSVFNGFDPKGTLFEDEDYCLHFFGNYVKEPEVSYYNPPTREERIRLARLWFENHLIWVWWGTVSDDQKLLEAHIGEKY